MAAVLADLDLDRALTSRRVAGSRRAAGHWLGPAVLASLSLWALIGLGVGAIVGVLG